jgi:hypothetical protein
MNPHHRELPVASARRFGAPCRSGFQVVRDGIDGYQHLHRQRPILDGDAELLLDAEHQFQRVDRVESDAAGSEQRGAIVDLLDRRGEIQSNGQDFPDLLFRRIRFQRVSPFFLPVDESGGMALAGNFLYYDAIPLQATDNSRDETWNAANLFLDGGSPVGGLMFRSWHLMISP